MKTTIGGDRLGSGNKLETSFKNYERSTHDLGYLWRSPMSAGTLVPFMSKLALPGDKWDINLSCEVLTLPTIGPLFGSYKVQLDVFEIPIRLYNAKLHMNKLGIGMDMAKIMIPQMEMLTQNNNQAGFSPDWSDNAQIGSSSLAKYLGISGIGSWDAAIATNPINREFNAIPLLSYWDVYKNYYSNKQEERGFYIHTSQANIAAGSTPTGAMAQTKNMAIIGMCLEPEIADLETGCQINIAYPSGAVEPDFDQLPIKINGNQVVASTIFNSYRWDDAYKFMYLLDCKEAHDASTITVPVIPSPIKTGTKYFFGLEEFDLKNIDTMREQILQYPNAAAFKITKDSLEPYNALMQAITYSNRLQYSCQFNQESLALKTYQSDLFNNWINTEWIEGAGGISELTAVDTTGDNFTIDALNIASKVYEMLNRIAVSGGTYDDWLEAVYTHERVKGVESPVYCGSLIKELGFQEVISNAETIDPNDQRKQPLGTLAGRGRLSGKNKGGRITISVNEPSYILGLVSITPRVDYSQGNQWDMNLKTFDDFHKPALDAIGFQDLITDQLLWSDTRMIDNGEVEPSFKSLGKQPAWLNYMTDVNRVYGGFAEEDNAMYMVLNRRYEKNPDGTLKDGTTYIDPAKYNNIFAQTSLDAQNFWVQISNDIIARRKMSAKIIPNL